MALQDNKNKNEKPEGPPSPSFGNHATGKQHEEAGAAFLASLSKELQDPLRTIAARVEALLQTQLDVQQAQDIAAIQDSTDSLQVIVNSLLSAVDDYLSDDNRLGRHIDEMLDIDADDDSELLASDHGLECLKHNRRDLNILLAEDDAISQMYLAAFLRSQGWKVDAVYNGRAAFEKFENEKYDLVILDGQMPEMDGFETARKIREAETAGTRTPMLAISGYAIPGDKEKFINSGMDDYIAKPVNETQLLKLICQLTG